MPRAEGKSVAQQESGVETASGETPADGTDPAVLAKKKRLELARCDVVRRLSLARAEPHREILKRALAALEAEIAAIRA